MKISPFKGKNDKDSVFLPIFFWEGMTALPPDMVCMRLLHSYDRIPGGNSGDTIVMVLNVAKNRVLAGFDT